MIHYSDDYSGPVEPIRIPPKYTLIYYITERLLTGNAGGHQVSIPALSGGGGASSLGITAREIVNNPYFTSKKSAGHTKAQQRGGPIPVGKYKIKPPYKHPQLGLCAFLEPMGETGTYLRQLNRGGFFIHGAGKLGSDGCIVPINSNQFRQLMQLLESDGDFTLLVIETAIDGRFA